MQYKKEEVRARIIKSAEEQFLKDGYFKASVLKIAHSAGVPVGNLYRYFKNKDELFDCVVEEAYHDLPVFLSEAYISKVDKNRVYNAEEIASNISLKITEFFDKYGRQLLILIDKSEGSKFAKFYPDLKFNISKMLEEGLFGGDYNNPSLMAEIITGGFVDGLVTILRNVQESERKQVIAKLIIFYFSDAIKRI